MKGSVTFCCHVNYWIPLQIDSLLKLSFRMVSWMLLKFFSLMFCNVQININQLAALHRATRLVTTYPGFISSPHSLISPTFLPCRHPVVHGSFSIFLYFISFYCFSSSSLFLFKFLIFLYRFFYICIFFRTQTQLFSISLYDIAI